MYLGVDIGGSKTLVATLDDNGVIQEKSKFATAEKYEEFLSLLAANVDKFSTKDYKFTGVGMPVTYFDRENGIGLSFGNLPWRNVPIQTDLERITGSPVMIENDAKLAGLSEAMLRPNRRKVLYVTISTGIGYSLIVDRKIDSNIGDGGGRLIMLEHKGHLMSWEDFASGRAIVERFGRRAEEITDEPTWRRIAHDETAGFMQLIAVTEPDVVVVGGSVGNYFERFQPFLEAELKKLETPLLSIPPLEKARRAEEAVVYGCYDLVKNQIGSLVN